MAGGKVVFALTFMLSGIRPYKCTLCPSDFKDNRALKKHILKIHGQETGGGISKELNLKIIKVAHKRKINIQ